MYYTFHFLRKSFMFNKSKNSSKTQETTVLGYVCTN